MGKIIETRASKINLLEPHEAGKNDPPMQEWLQLPAADGCPSDSTHQEWGTMNGYGYFPVRICHICGAKFRPAVNVYILHGIFDALMGTPKRLLTGYVETDDFEKRALAAEAERDRLKSLLEEVSERIGNV